MKIANFDVGPNNGHHRKVELKFGIWLDNDNLQTCNADHSNVQYSNYGGIIEMIMKTKRMVF